MLEPQGHPPRRCSTPSSTRGRRTIVAQAGRLGAVTVATNMAGRGVDILLGGNPEGLARQEVQAQGLEPESDEGQALYNQLLPKFEDETQGRGRQGARARRPLRARQRAPREPPHRQPAAGPLRPPGRPGREPVLPVARGRAHAPVRHRRHELGDGQGPARRRAHRGEDGHQGHRAGPEHRRAAQRRDPQERPQVRRGPQRAAQGHLRPAHADHRRRRPARGDAARSSRRAIDDVGRRRTARPTTPRTGTSRACSPRPARTTRPSSPPTSCARPPPRTSWPRA